jgi:O-antigen ligase
MSDSGDEHVALRSARFQGALTTRRPGRDSVVAMPAVVGGGDELEESDWLERFAPAGLLLAAVAAATFVQGGFFARGQIATAALLAAAMVAAAPFSRARYPELRLPLAAGGMLASWGLLRAVPGGSLAGAAHQAVLLVGLATALLLCRRLDEPGRRLVLTGLLGVGVVVAVVGWMAVAWRLTPWAIPSAGLWRATSTLTYSNAAAAVLVPLAVTAAALLSTRVRSLPLALTLTLLLLGVAVTLSRAGALALLVGLGVLVFMRGWAVLRALLAPLAGAAVAFLGLLPSMPVFPQPRPGLAVATLAGGLGLTTLLLRYVRGRNAVMLGVIVAIGLVVGTATFSKAGTHVWNRRVSLSSPSRSNAATEALHLAKAHPVAGVGIGSVVVTGTDSTGRRRIQEYFHNEYLQTLVEQGAIGAVLLLALLAGLARLLWLSRPAPAGQALRAGVIAACAAAAVHAGFDFIWHVPAVPLLLVVLIGLVITPAARVVRGP